MKELKFQPYDTENLIFIDTEFSSLDPEVGEILSIGIVKLDGSELYIELEHDGEVSDWVDVNILPMLDKPKVSRQQAKSMIEDFLEGKLPYAVAFVDNYDVIYLTKVFGHGNLPFKWATIDLASVLFALGINPVKFGGDRNMTPVFYSKLGIDMSKYRKHHALDDAKLLRNVWQALVDKSK